MKNLLVIMLLLCASVMSAYAGDIDTYTGDDWTWYMFSSDVTNAADQWFTVPVGNIGTKIEFFVEKGVATAGTVNVAIYKSDNTLVATASMAVADFGGSNAWVAVNNLNLSPGLYYAQVFTNDEGLKANLAAKLYNPSTYTGGNAAAGWSGATPVNGDFAVRLTVSPRPFTGVIQTYPDAGPTSGVYGTDWRWYMFTEQGAGVADQWFTVPSGQTCTKFEFLVEKDGASNPGYHAIVQIFKNGTDYIKGAIKSADTFAGSRDWVVVDNLNLQPGNYLAQVFTNDADFKPYLAAPIRLTNIYTDGYAAAYWQGTTPLGNYGYDFAVRLTLVRNDVDFEATRIGWYDTRWSFDGDPNILSLCDQGAERISSTGVDTVLPYLGGVNWTNYDAHISAAFGDRRRLGLIFQFNDYDISTQNANAIISNVVSFDPEPGCFGWYTGDEPYDHGVSLSNLQFAYNAIKQYSGKPVFIAFNHGDVDNLTPVNYKTAYDVMMVDNYPCISGTPQFQGLEGWKSFINTAKLQAQEADKPWWSIVQAMGMAPHAGWIWRLPTFAEEKFMVYWSVLQGASGIMLWDYAEAVASTSQPEAPYSKDGSHWLTEVAQPIIAGLESCSSAIIAGPVSNAVTDNSLDVISNVYVNEVNEYFLIAANSTPGVENVTFTLNLPIGFSRAVPLTEYRSEIDISSGTLSDNFSDYQVHIYRLMPIEQVINTWTGTTSWWPLQGNGNVAAQWFTVPLGTKSTKFEFFCEKGVTEYPGYYSFVQIYTSDNTFVAQGYRTADEFLDEFGYPSTSDWVSVDNLNLPSGEYFAQMFTNQEDFLPDIHAAISASSNFAGGYAAAGWDGGIATGDGQDFKARFTIVPNAVLTPQTCDDIKQLGLLLDGDINKDCYVNLQDLNLMALSWLNSNCSNPTWCLGADVDMSGKTSFKDFAIIADEWLLCNNPADLNCH